MTQEGSMTNEERAMDIVAGHFGVVTPDWAIVQAIAAALTAARREGIEATMEAVADVRLMASCIDNEHREVVLSWLDTATGGIRSLLDAPTADRPTTADEPRSVPARSRLMLTLETPPGACWPEVMDEMARIAKALGVTVHTRFNGCDRYARPTPPADTGETT